MFREPATGNPRAKIVHHHTLCWGTYHDINVVDLDGITRALIPVPRLPIQQGTPLNREKHKSSISSKPNSLSHIKYRGEAGPERCSNYLSRRHTPQVVSSEVPLPFYCLLGGVQLEWQGRNVTTQKNKNKDGQEKDIRPEGILRTGSSKASCFLLDKQASL